MIIRKVKEIGSHGNITSVPKVDLDTNKVNIDQNKRTDGSKKIEVTNIQANVLKGGRDDSTQLKRIVMDSTIGLFLKTCRNYENTYTFFHIISSKNIDL